MAFTFAGQLLDLGPECVQVLIVLQELHVGTVGLGGQAVQLRVVYLISNTWKNEKITVVKQYF